MMNYYSFKASHSRGICSARFAKQMCLHHGIPAHPLDYLAGVHIKAPLQTRSSTVSEWAQPPIAKLKARSLSKIILLVCIFLSSKCDLG